MGIYRRFVAVCLVIVMAGCGSVATQEPVEQIEAPAATDRPAPTPTYSLDEGEAITSPDELMGIWFSLKSNNYSLFREDGFYAGALNRTDLQTGNGLQGQFWFEDDVLYIEIERIIMFDGEELEDVANSYTVLRFPDETIRFFAVETELEFLSNWMAGDAGVVVAFHRVD